jgi:sugar/nucleoside kinase (ribokinase family)
MAPGTITPELVSGRVLIVDATDVGASVAAARLARAGGIPVIVDIDGPVDGHEELLRQVNILVANESAIQMLGGRTQTGAAMHELATRYRSEVVVATLGAAGAVALCQGQEVRSPGRPVVVVDTTGAGDAFRAGFAAGWLRGGDEADLESILAYANAVAALNCRALGAQAALPAADEVDRLL